MTRTVAWIALLAWLALACSGSTATVRDTRRDDAVITLACEVGDAEVWINDRRVGLVGDLGGGIALPPQTPHRLEVRHDEFHTHYAELTLQQQERRAIAIELAPRLP